MRIFSAIGIIYLSFTNGHAMNKSIDNYLTDINFSGVVLVEKSQKIIHHHAYGMSNIEDEIPNTLNTVFPIASITKPLTATLIMQQLEENKNLTLQSNLGDFIDYPFHVNPTLQDLLQHTSGLTVFSDFTHHDSNRQYTLSNTNLYKRLNSGVSSLQAPSFQYNNGNYILLGHILEKLSACSYREYFSKKLFIPLGMTNTTFVKITQQDNMHATGYLSTNPTLTKAPSIDESWLGCGAGIATISGDLHLFITAYLQEKLVKSETIHKMQHPNAYNYGLGWTTESTNENTAFYHEGGISGFSTFLYHDPIPQLTIIALSNVETDIEKITRHIFKQSQILYP